MPCSPLGRGVRGDALAIEMLRSVKYGLSPTIWIIASACAGWGIQEWLAQAELAAASNAEERGYAHWRRALGDMENSLLQIDFSRSLTDLPLGSSGATVNATLAESHIICALPQPEEDAFDTWQPHPTELKPLVPNVGSSRLSVAYPEMRDHLRTARLRWLVDRCFQFKEEKGSEWTYEVCIG